MTPDPIVAEVRAIREQLAAQCHFDIREIIADARRRQAQSNSRIVSFQRPHPTDRQDIQPAPDVESLLGR